MTKASMFHLYDEKLYLNNSLEKKVSFHHSDLNYVSVLNLKPPKYSFERILDYSNLYANSFRFPKSI